VRETLRQCEPDGVVTAHLGAKYEKPLRQLLKREWSARQQALRDAVATRAAALLLYQEYREHGIAKEVAAAGANVHRPQTRSAPPPTDE
jgi:hypothetical protein